MNIGSLTATLGVETAQATAGMTAFQSQMLSSVNKINTTLSTMSAAMLKVGASANIMATGTLAATNKIVIATSSASTGTASFAAKIAAGNAAAAVSYAKLETVATATTAKIATAATEAATATTTATKTATASVNMMAQRVRTVGYLASAIVTAPLVMAGKSLIKMASDFEFTLKKMIGLAGVSKGSIEQISKDIKKIASDTGVNPQNVAEAYYYTASSGIKKAADVLKITEMSAKGAASGMGEVTDIAKLLTSAMNAYSEKGLKVAAMMDILTATIRVGKAEPAEMVTALGTILPIAKELGLKMQDVGGALATMTLITNSTATSATYLRNVLMKLLDPTPQVRKAMADMQIPIEQIHILLRKPDGFIKTMELLGTTTEKYGVTMDALFPEMRSLLGALNFTGDGLQRLKDNTLEVNKSTGDFQKHLSEMSETMKMRLNKATSDSKNAMLDLGAAMAITLVPIFEFLAKVLQKVVTWFNSLNQTTKTIITVFIALVAATGPILLLISLFMYLAPAILAVKTAFIGLVAIMAANPYVALASVLMGVVGYMILSNRETEKAVVNQKALNTELEKGMDLMANDGTIKERMAIVKSMNLRQLQDLKQQIESEKKEREDYAVELISKTSKTEKELYNLTEKGQKEKNSLIARELFAQAQVKSKFLYDDLLVEKWINDESLKELDKYQKQVDAAIKSKPTIATKSEKDKDIEEIMKKYSAGLKAIGVEANVMGSRFDAVTPALNLTKSTLKSLFQVPNVTGKEAAFGKVIGDLEKFDLEAEFVKATIDELNGKLETNKILAELMGNGYNLAEMDLKDLTSTLEKFGREGIKTGVEIEKLQKDITAAKNAMVLANTDLQKALAQLALRNSLMGKQWGTTKEQKQIEDLTNQLEIYRNEIQRLNNFKLENKVIDPNIEKNLKSATDKVTELQGALDKISKKQFIISIVTDIGGGVSNFMGNMISYIGIQKQNALQAIQDIEDAKRQSQEIADAREQAAESMKDAKNSKERSEIQTTLNKRITAINKEYAAQKELQDKITAINKAYNEKMQKWAIAQATINIALEIIKSLKTPWLIPLIAAAGAVQLAIIKEQKFAQGGVVPPGYPNDSYPARLTSGEMVVPPGKLSSIQGNGNVEISVIMEPAIKGTDIHFIVKEVQRKYKNSMV
jgi:TP901 family phage tail tape measure protein